MSFFIEQQTIANGIESPYARLASSFMEREDAIAAIARIQQRFKLHKFQEEQGYWWARNDDGPLFRFVIRAK